MNKIEDAVLKEVIPTLDELFIDEATAVVFYIAAHGSTMFYKYMNKKHKEHGRVIPMLMAEIAEEARVKATVAANKVAKPYLDTLDYYEAMAATMYISANIAGTFSVYMIARGIIISATKYNRQSSVDKAEQTLSEIRRRVGL